MIDVTHDERANNAFIGLIIDQIKVARKASLKAIKEEEHVFSMINDFVGDIDNFPSGAENADNLSDAISCYINYGEYDLNGIEKELREAIPKD
jgi:hypothetical protein